MPHCVHKNVVHSGMATKKQPPKKRVRPTLTVTIDPQVHDRLRALVDALPGATLSVLLDELLVAALPIFEDMAAAVRGADGDEQAAQDTLAALIGARILRATGVPFPGDLEAQREARLDAAYRGENPYRKAPVQDTPKRGETTT